MSSHHEMANLTEEKCQKSGKKYGVVCCPCRSTFVASLLKNPLYLELTILDTPKVLIIVTDFKSEVRTFISHRKITFFIKISM